MGTPQKLPTFNREQFRLGYAAADADLKTEGDMLAQYATPSASFVDGYKLRVRFWLGGLR